MIEVGQLTDRLSSIRELPTFPTTALEVMRLASDSGSSAAELSRIISKDPSLAARILRVANSPFYGFARKVSTIEWAVVALGFETLRETVLSLTLIDFFKGSALKHFDPKKFWKHAIDTATAGRSLAKEMKYRLPGEAYAVGLLHDVGTLVLYRYFRDDFEEIQRLIFEENLQPLQAEAVAIGTTHADVGAWITDKWSFPSYFVEAIRFHHTPGYAETNPELTAIVHVANQIASVNGYSCSDQPIKFDFAAVQIIGIEKLGISVKALADKYLDDDSSATVRVKVPIMDYALQGNNTEFEGAVQGAVANEVDDETLRRFFKDAIKLLPSTERLVVTLKLYEGLELRQVATVLGYEEARVAEHYRNAVSVLQQMAERAILTNRLGQWKTRF
ncbi:MAG: HDOD domain-containing protein [Bacteroidetes bacterium]|nr:HDOD domain-containing protein [Bacteroidota bacterium]MCL5738259.1 HDOD domain-containing protein [Bacteroidota bacterium]